MVIENIINKLNILCFDDFSQRNADECMHKYVYVKKSI